MGEKDSNDYFLNVLLQFDKLNKSRQVTEEYVTNNIVYGLKTLFGEDGAAFPFSILQLTEESDKISQIYSKRPSRKESGNGFVETAGWFV